MIELTPLPQMRFKWNEVRFRVSSHLIFSFEAHSTSAIFPVVSALTVETESGHSERARRRKEVETDESILGWEGERKNGREKYV